MIAKVTIAVNIPDGVEDVDEYLNETTFEAIHPDGGDIYDMVVNFN